MRRNWTRWCAARSRAARRSIRRGRGSRKRASCVPRAPARPSSRRRSQRRHRAAADRSCDGGLPAGAQPGAVHRLHDRRRRLVHFDIFGGTRRELEGLAAQIDYQAYELEAARLTLAANVVTTAIRLAGLRAEIESNEAILATQTSELAIAEQRLALGGVARARRAQSAGARSPTRRRRCRRSMRSASARSICLRSTWASRRPRCRFPTLRLADLRLPVAIPLRLPADLVRQRPDIRASEALLHRASADIGVATANLYPKLQISGSLATSQLSAADLFGNGFNVWNIGANLLQPLCAAASCRRASAQRLPRMSRPTRRIGRRCCRAFRTSPTCCARSKPTRAPRPRASSNWRASTMPIGSRRPLRCGRREPARRPRCAAREAARRDGARAGDREPAVRRGRAVSGAGWRLVARPGESCERAIERERESTDLSRSTTECATASRTPAGRAGPKDRARPCPVS